MPIPWRVWARCQESLAVVTISEVAAGRCTSRPVASEAPPEAHLLEHCHLGGHRGAQWTLKDVPVELQSGHASMHSIGEGGLVARRRQQAELLPTNGGGACCAVHLGLVLVNSGAGQVSIAAPSEGKPRQKHGVQPTVRKVMVSTTTRGVTEVRSFPKRMTSWPSKGEGFKTSAKYCKDGEWTMWIEASPSSIIAPTTGERRDKPAEGSAVHQGGFGQCHQSQGQTASRGQRSVDSGSIPVCAFGE